MPSSRGTRDARKDCIELFVKGRPDAAEYRTAVRERALRLPAAAREALQPSVRVRGPDVAGHPDGELLRGIRGMLGRTLRVHSSVPNESAIVLGTLADLKQAGFWKIFVGTGAGLTPARSWRLAASKPTQRPASASSAAR